MIRLHACPTAWERSEWRQPCRVFLIRRYQVASADRAGDGCITSRLLVAGLPTGAWGEPSDLITMVTSALFIRWHRGVAHSRHAHNRCMVPFHPNLDGQSGVGVLDNNFNCWGAQTACRRSRELVLRKCVLNPRCKLCYDNGSQTGWQGSHGLCALWLLVLQMSKTGLLQWSKWLGRKSVVETHSQSLTADANPWLHL